MAITDMMTTVIMMNNGDRDPCVHHIRYHHSFANTFESLITYFSHERNLGSDLSHRKNVHFKFLALAIICERRIPLSLCWIPSQGALAGNDVARDFAESKIPYRHQVSPPDDEPRHSLLIVGVDTMSDDPQEHSCLVKNTHGLKWGVQGYSRVGFEVFLTLLVPVQKHPMNLQCRRRKRQRQQGKGKHGERHLQRQKGRRNVNDAVSLHVQ